MLNVRGTDCIVGGDAGTGVPASSGDIALFTGDELSCRNRGVSAFFNSKNLEFVGGIWQEKLRRHRKRVTDPERLIRALLVFPSTQGSARRGST